jgi:hypothetical protein
LVVEEEVDIILVVVEEVDWFTIKLMYLFQHLHILLLLVVVALVMQLQAVTAVLESLQYLTLSLHLAVVVVVPDHLVRLEHLVDLVVVHLLMDHNQHQRELEIQVLHQEQQIKFLQQMVGVMMVGDKLHLLELPRPAVVVVQVELVKLERPHHMHQELLDLVVPD